MKIAICDDDQKNCLLVKEMITRYCQEEKIQDVWIRIFNTPLDLLDKYPRELDLMLLDIEMPGMDGIQAAREIRRFDRKVILIYMTNYAKYALDGYSVQAYNYLLKPVTYEILSRELRTVFRLIGQRKGSSVTLHCEDGYFTLSPEDIEMAETKGKIVLGAGGAGMAAAASAIAVETDDEAYASLIADVAADFEAWKESGTDTLFDSPNWHALQTYTGGGEIGDLDLIRTYAEDSVDTLSWLVDDIGVQFKTDYIFMAIGGKWIRGHQIDMLAATGAEGDNGGNVYITKLKERTDANGVEIYTDAKVTKILMDENGRACGAVAERSDGSTITVNASKAVILATGGFAANSEMVYEYSNGAITTPLTSCATSSTGDGIGLAEEVGASMTDLDQIQVHPLGDPHNDCGCVAEFVGNWLSAQYYMFVNKEGERFVKEDGTRYEMSMAELEQTDDQMWLIVDSSQIAGDDTRTAQIESLIADGHTVKGDTLEELAEQIGVDLAVLQATVDKYNAGMESGEDEFGKATDPNATISVGPFYASLRTPTVHHTMGGVTINSNAEVIDTEGNVIPGFYAAGEVAGGIHGNNRLGGNAFSDIMTFGRIAGENAAAAE